MPSQKLRPVQKSAPGLLVASFISISVAMLDRTGEKTDASVVKILDLFHS